MATNGPASPDLPERPENQTPGGPGTPGSPESPPDTDGADNDPLGDLSFIRPIGYSNSNHCGYCHGKTGDGNPKKRFSYYASSHSLTPALYQDLIDRCWRRSGTLLYRPNQRNMCCAHYTLRLDAANFHATRDQRQAVNRFNRHVTGEAYAHEAARLRPRSRQEAKQRETIFELVERIHEAEFSKLPGPTLPAHRFEVTLEHDTFTEEKFLVFENYQRVVHKEVPSRDGFSSFLCDSPLRRGIMTDEQGRVRSLGSFHQCYRLDGVLVAIGVLDLLPHAVSAVYFLYHESIHQHNPGKLGALREIAFAREAGYRWWYSGYYIHSCPKMRYKIDYAPQYVLDPESLDWDLLDKKTLALFDKSPYISLSEIRREAGGENSTTGSSVETAIASNADGTDEETEEEEHPLLTSNMPGLPPFDVIEALDLGNIPIQTSGPGGRFPVRNLVVWPLGSIHDPYSFKCKVAELVAVMGPDLISKLCLDFQRYK